MAIPVQFKVVSTGFGAFRAVTVGKVYSALLLHKGETLADKMTGNHPYTSTDVTAATALVFTNDDGVYADALIYKHEGEFEFVTE